MLSNMEKIMFLQINISLHIFLKCFKCFENLTYSVSVMHQDFFCYTVICLCTWLGSLISMKWSSVVGV